jgi:hypothetical protein
MSSEIEAFDPSISTRIATMESNGQDYAIFKPQVATRYLELAVACDATGIARFTFSPPFAKIFAVSVEPSWDGTQLISGGEVAGTRSLSGVDVLGMQSRGSLLLSSGPMEKAATGKVVKITVIGN